MKHTLIALALGALGFFTAMDARAGVITGDSFDLTVTENGIELDQQSGIAGAMGPDIDSNALSQLTIDWLDGNTVELDFFGSSPLTNLVIELSDLDFNTAGVDEDIIGLNIVSALFGFTVDLAFTASTITIAFPALDTIMAADGEILVIQVLTAPSAPTAEVPLPAGIWLFLSGLGALGARRFFV